MSFLVAIEGIDGSGKGTQSQLLCQRIEESGSRSALLSFPRYSETRFGKAVGDFLNGRFGSLEQVDPFLASLLYAGDRFESRDLLLETLEKNDVVVLDRYVASNIGHQASKRDGEERKELVEWIESVEYDIFKLPRPDLVILLDLPAIEAQTLIARKQARDYTEKKADIQEADGGYLEKVRSVYLELAEKEPTWNLVRCLDGDSLRSIEDINEEIWQVVDAHRRNRNDGE